MHTRKIKANITSEHKLDVILPPDFRPGEVEVIIFQRESGEINRKQNIKDYFSHIEKGIFLGGSTANSRDELHERSAE